MSETTYTYLITDTLNNTWNQSHLEEDILNSAKIHIELLSSAELDGAINLVFFNALPDVEHDYLTYLIANHDGTELIPEDLKTSNGALITSVTYGTYPEDAGFKGFYITASGVDTDTMTDYKIERQSYMNGGQYWNHGGAYGDYLESSIVDKDNVLGLFDIYGLTPGVDILELFKFAETIYFNPESHVTVYLNTPDSALVYPGLYLRTKVHTTTDVSVHFGVTYFWFAE